MVGHNRQSQYGGLSLLPVPERRVSVNRYKIKRIKVVMRESGTDNLRMTVVICTFLIKRLPCAAGPARQAGLMLA